MVLERRWRACPPRLAARTREIASITGHAALAEIERYSKAANQTKLAVAAFLKLEQNAKRTASGKRTPPTVANGDQGLKMLIQFQLPALTLRCQGFLTPQRVRQFPSAKTGHMFSMACPAIAKRPARLHPARKVRAAEPAQSPSDFTLGAPIVPKSPASSPASESGGHADN